MRRALGVIVLAATLAAATRLPAADGVGSLKTEKERTSYALGLDVGRSMGEMDMDLDMEVFIQGLRHSVGKEKALMTDQEVNEVKKAMFMKMRERQSKKMAEQAAKDKDIAEQNKKEGVDFLAQNGKAAGVVTTASGLQYTVLKQGDGPKPKATDRVRVHYRGTLQDGREFDSSHTRGQPATFAVNGVIRGWTEALQLMNVGGKCKLFVPSDLAYGPQRRSELIGPNQMLIFEVELLGIEGPAEAKPVKP